MRSGAIRTVNDGCIVSVQRPVVATEGLGASVIVVAKVTMVSGILECQASRQETFDELNKQPRHSNTDVDRVQRIQLGDNEHDVPNDVGDHFPVFGHDASHGGLSFKAKQYSSFRVSNQ